MILTGPAIQGAVERGEIDIDPFNPERLNPASYDLELGREVGMYSAIEQPLLRDRTVDGLGGWICQQGSQFPDDSHTLDSKRREELTIYQMSLKGFTVKPGHLYLMHTRERIHTRRYVPIIDGKSSIGRLGLLVHVTAGYGDPGFDGQYTLEIVALAHPVIVYPGMRIAQMRFHCMHGAALDYQERGNYTGDDARGPVRSASWRQFR